MKKKLIWIAIALSTAMAIRFFNQPQLQRYEEHTQQLGTLAQLVLVLPQSFHAKQRSEELFQMAYNEMARLDRIFSRYRADSELSALNARAGQDVAVSTEFAYVLQRALDISHQTEGAFDVTIFPLLKLWWQASEQNQLPTDDQIKNILERVGYQKIQWNAAKSSVKVPQSTLIDLGGIAKGYVIERIRDLWVQAGVKHGLINIGGDLWAIGHNDVGKPWRLAIQDPQDTSKTLTYVDVSDEGMVTSGDYQRTFDIEGRSYSHILDPRTGRPVEGAASITLIGKDMLRIDALATALSVMGLEATKNIMDQNRDDRFLCVFEEGVLNSLNS